MSEESSSSERKISRSHLDQIAVLRTMASEETSEQRLLQIEEIAERSGVGDEREIQRYLFILEGQKLVTPHPSGDFTSKTWQITKVGIKALRTIQKSTVL
ncbi:MAG: hypothetical protein KDD42_02285 [Bdellovibrionales bacterium]|nr:hypothetical protein [Bdellovibrionales bacterium]